MTVRRRTVTLPCQGGVGPRGQSIKTAATCVSWLAPRCPATPGGSAYTGAVRLAAFFALTFAATWAAWLLPAALHLPRSGVFALGGPVFLLGVFAPALVAVGLTARTYGRDGVVRLLEPVGRWQVPARYYLFAVGFTAATRLAAATIGEAADRRLAGVRLDAVLARPARGHAAVDGRAVRRGSGLARLCAASPGRRTRARSGQPGALLSLWATWHLPLFVIPGSGSDGQSFPVYVLFVTALSVAMAWLYRQTGGSLLLTMLMHAAINNTGEIVPAATTTPAGIFSWRATPMAWTTLAVMWSVAGVLLVRMRDARDGRATG